MQHKPCDLHHIRRALTVAVANQTGFERRTIVAEGVENRQAPGLLEDVSPWLWRYADDAGA
jgi:hypothetical protein